MAQLGVKIEAWMADRVGSTGAASTGADASAGGSVVDVPEAVAVDATSDVEASGSSIVVVDDEETIVAGMTALLEGWGAEVLGSLTGDDVIARVHAAGRLPDLLIVDFRLGDRDTGIDLAEELRRQLDPEIPAVLVTGSITPDLEERARHAGLGYLLKPVNAATLARCIEALLPVQLG